MKEHPQPQRKFEKTNPDKPGVLDRVRKLRDWAKDRANDAVDSVKDAAVLDRDEKTFWEKIDSVKGRAESSKFAARLEQMRQLRSEDLADRLLTDLQTNKVSDDKKKELLFNIVSTRDPNVDREMLAGRIDQISGEALDQQIHMNAMELAHRSQKDMVPSFGAQQLRAMVQRIIPGQSSHTMGALANLPSGEHADPEFDKHKGNFKRYEPMRTALGHDVNEQQTDLLREFLYMLMINSTQGQQLLHDSQSVDEKKKEAADQTLGQMRERIIRQDKDGLKQDIAREGNRVLHEDAGVVRAAYKEVARQDPKHLAAELDKQGVKTPDKIVQDAGLQESMAQAERRVAASKDGVLKILKQDIERGTVSKEDKQEIAFHMVLNTLPMYQAYKANPEKARLAAMEQVNGSINIDDTIMSAAREVAKSHPDNVSEIFLAHHKGEGYVAMEGDYKNARGKDYLKDYQNPIADKATFVETLKAGKDLQKVKDDQLALENATAHIKPGKQSIVDIEINYKTNKLIVKDGLFPPMSGQRERLLEVDLDHAKKLDLTALGARQAHIMIEGVPNDKQEKEGIQIASGKRTNIRISGYHEDEGHKLINVSGNSSLAKAIDKSNSNRDEHFAAVDRDNLHMEQLAALDKARTQANRELALVREEAKLTKIQARTEGVARKINSTHSAMAKGHVDTPAQQRYAMAKASMDQDPNSGLHASLKGGMAKKETGQALGTTES